MPHMSYPNTIIQDGERNISLRYECWKNEANKEGMVYVEGNSNEDHSYLINNRTDVADMLKQQENLDSMRYFESQGNGRSTEISLKSDEYGKIVESNNIHSGFSNKELNELGQKYIDQEYEHNVNLYENEIKDNPEFTRSKHGHGPEI